MEKSHHFDFLPEQRHLLLTYKLLAALEPVKLHALASDLHVTTATVSSDLDHVAEWLEAYQLTLVRRRGFGVQVTGEEAAKRRALSGLLSNHIEETELLRFIRRNSLETTKSDTISSQLLGFVRNEQLTRIESAVEEVNKSLPAPIADTSYIALVVHLALAMERITKGENIEMKQELLDRLKPTNEFKLASELARSLEEIFHTTLPEEEVGYITMHLRGAKLQHEKLSYAESEYDVTMIVKRLIRHVSQEYGVDFTEDDSLEQGLHAHLAPALYRMAQQMRINNPLLENIQTNYPQLFHVISNCMARISPDIHVPDDEIGFLVLHFGSTLERSKKLVTYRAFVICSSGIGSSKMMASRLQKEFPSITDIHLLSLFDLQQVEIGPADLVISTIPLEEEEVDYIQVNPFLTDQEIRQIEGYISRKAVFQRKETVPPATPARPSDVTLESLRDLLMTTVRLLEHVEVVQEETSTEIWHSMYNMMTYLEDKKLIKSAEEVNDKLKIRENLSGVGLPGTALALFHTRSSSVNEPVFLIYERKEPESLEAMDGSTISVKRILIMLAPENTNNVESSALSTISGMIVQTKESIRLFETGSENDIKTFMSNEFLNLYRNNLS
ncbi:BglG family transcription antiterminator [Alkalicoccus halolimnae]|uniref:PRD domain-containing protein n=1 Tax=Alkalicoccus halolimnae TaxID=1667239 RepID=A0A5C7FG68_9BACI|nr:PRD domain-containing protein [Alkalicoccus halolimnae]TXF85264.1 PRD domain-containing protein [Alkalicoccus halolimnae]